MKHLVKTIRFYAFSILYSLVILSYAFITNIPNSSFLIGQTSLSDHSDLIISQGLFPQTTPVEERIVTPNVSNAHIILRSALEGALLVDLYQGLLCHVFSEYHFYAKTQAFLLQKTDIIFPFHYFW